MYIVALQSRFPSFKPHLKRISIYLQCVKAGNHCTSTLVKRIFIHFLTHGTCDVYELIYCSSSQIYNMVSNSLVECHWSSKCHDFDSTSWYQSKYFINTHLVSCVTCSFQTISVSFMWVTYFLYLFSTTLQH